MNTATIVQRQDSAPDCREQSLQSVIATGLRAQRVGDEIRPFVRGLVRHLEAEGEISPARTAAVLATVDSDEAASGRVERAQSALKAAIMAGLMEGRIDLAEGQRLFERFRLRNA